MIDKYAVLKKYFGYNSFRKGQQEIIDSILGGRDVLAVMPTGAGKSLCYQIPALMLRGITLVVSPLISLMQDQVRILKASGVPAAYLNSSLTPAQIRLATERAAQGWYKIIYVAPERLMSENFIEFAVHADISMVAVDEAHCISMWGHEFRPGYRKISEFVNKLPFRPVIAAFTATADGKVRYDISKMLCLRNYFQYSSGFDRPELYFSAVCMDNGERDFEHDKGLNFLISYIKGHKEESGIVYCVTRGQTQAVYEALAEEDIRSCIYHAGIDNQTRKQIQEDFTFDRVKVIIATNAFGMGIDKPDIRYVINYGMPPTIEDYYQQAGRAGRDGQPADCILLYDNKGYMLIKNSFILRPREDDEMSPEDRRKYISVQLSKLSKMYRYAFSDKICLRKQILEYFGEKAPKNCNNCSVCRKISLIQVQKTTVDYDKELYEKLRSHIKILSIRSGLPVYAIASYSVLQEIAKAKPKNMSELRKIKGLSEEKLRRYGQDIIDITSKYK